MNRPLYAASAPMIALSSLLHHRPANHQPRTYAVCSAPSIRALRTGLGALAILSILAPTVGISAEFQPLPGDEHSSFGTQVSISGTTALLGVSGARVYHGHTPYYSQGVAYGVTHINGDEEPNLFKFTSSDGQAWDQFGRSVSISNGSGLVGINNAVYWYKDLDTGNATQVIKINNPGSSDNYFGGALSLSGNIAVVTAQYSNINSKNLHGAAYLTRIDNDVVTDTARLLPSDGRTGGIFGLSVSVSGSIALVGANPGAYLYTNLDTATGDVTQFAKLVSTGGSHTNSFGGAVSVDGTTGLVGANHANIGGKTYQGAAFVYRNLGSQTGNVYEVATLVASDGVPELYFGSSVAISQNVGLIGASNSTINGQTEQGAAYLYTGLQTATGVTTESLKITASTGQSKSTFGYSVAISGDNFLVGAMGSGIANAPDRVYSGSVSAMTTLNEGNTRKEIDAISFESRTDWIIGQTTDANEVLLSAGDSATVTHSNKAVYIGMEAGADNNTLRIKGTLTSNTLHVGSMMGNTGNTLQLDSTATLSPSLILLASGNTLSLEGDYTAIEDLLGYLNAAIDLRVWSGADHWVSIDALNYEDYLDTSFSDGYSHFTAIAPIPEPGTTALAGLGIGALLLLARSRARKSMRSTL